MFDGLADRAVLEKPPALPPLFTQVPSSARLEDTVSENKANVPALVKENVVWHFVDSVCVTKPDPDTNIK